MSSDAARAAAVRLMTAVTEEGRLLSALTADLTDLAPEARARAGRLATEALRWAQRSDRLLGPHLRLRPEDAVMNAMRLALFEVNVAGTPPHAAVGAAVDVTAKSKKGLVNAVLRNVMRREADWDALPLPTLPKWLRKPLIAAYGKDAVAAMEAVQARTPPLDLTVRRDAEGWAERLGGTVLPTGTVRLAEAGQVSRLAGFDEGAWWVQDAAAALPAKALEAKAGEQVLDLCAAPGGKTMQLAAAGADVTALDISEARLSLLRENLKRTGLSAEVVVADALTWEPDAPFDAILLDAPCSATGTLRRHPDLAHAKAGYDLAPLLALQTEMLDRALGWLRSGGRLVFCTCSLLPDEGEMQAASVLSRHADFTLDLPPIDGVPDAWYVETGLRTRPDYWADIGGLDGFFITRFRKAG